VGLHLRGERHMRPKLLISMGNQWIFDEQLTDSGKIDAKFQINSE